MAASVGIQADPLRLIAEANKPAMGLDQVPVIDMEASAEEITPLLQLACREYGFFYVRNSGVPPRLVQQHFAQSHAFFQLPLDVKASLKDDTPWAGTKGYSVLGYQTLNKETQTKGDTKENLKMSVHSDDPRPFDDDHANTWPPAHLLPHFRPTMVEYFSAGLQLVRRLIHALSLSLGLPADFLDSISDTPLATLRLHHYTSEKSDEEAGVFGAGAHTDWGICTILATDNVPGLQILHNGSWLDVPPKPDCFVVNLGDLMQRMTNDRYKSAMHRVYNHTAVDRYSTALFIEANLDAPISVLPSCCDASNPPRYPTVVSRDYTAAKIAKHGN